MSDLPSSTNLVRLEAKDYWITGARWQSEFNDCVEVGVRNKHHSKDFYLIQPERASEHNIELICRLIVLALDAGFLPSDLQRIF